MPISLSGCIETISNPNGRFKTLKDIYPEQNEDGLLQMHTANRSVSFRVSYGKGRYILQCFPGNNANDRQKLADICNFVSLIDSPYLSCCRFLPEEMLVFDSRNNSSYTDVILCTVPDATRLDNFIDRNWKHIDSPKLRQLIKGLAGLASWMSDNNFLHGRINNSNLWITSDTSPVLSDYTAACRQNPYDDVKILGYLAVLLYLTACDPRFHLHMMKLKSSGNYDKSLIFGSFLPEINDLVSDKSSDLKILLTRLLSDNNDKGTTEKICQDLHALAACEPGRIDGISEMLGYLDEEGVQVKQNSLAGHLKKYTYVGELHDMLRCAFDGESWSYLDKNGHTAIAGDFTNARDFIEGQAVVETEHGYGLIDRDGKFIISPRFDDMEQDVAANMIIVTKDGLSGLYSREGEAITGQVYDSILPSADGLFAVKRNRKYGYIRKDGTQAISIRYDDALSFRNGTARVSFKGREYLIDAQGEQIEEIVPVNHKNTL